METHGSSRTFSTRSSLTPPETLHIAANPNGINFRQPRRSPLGVQVQSPLSFHGPFIAVQWPYRTGLALLHCWRPFCSHFAKFSVFNTFTHSPVAVVVVGGLSRRQWVEKGASNWHPPLQLLEPLCKGPIAAAVASWILLEQQRFADLCVVHPPRGTTTTVLGVLNRCHQQESLERKCRISTMGQFWSVLFREEKGEGKLSTPPFWAKYEIVCDKFGECSTLSLELKQI